MLLSLLLFAIPQVFDTHLGCGNLGFRSVSGRRMAGHDLDKDRGD